LYTKPNLPFENFGERNDDRMTQLQLHVNLEITGTFRVGANPQPDNKFRLVIANAGEPVQKTGELMHFYLRGFLGSGAEALFLSESDARQCVKAVPGDWRAEWDFAGREAEKKIFKLKIYSYKKTLFQKEETIAFEFSRIESKTAPGDARLTFEGDVGAFKQDLFIPKTADKPGIVSFFSEPPEGVPNFPGETITLKWHTHGLSDRELIQVGRADPLAFIFDRDAGSKIVTVSDSDTFFRLQGFDGSRQVARELQVSVLDWGWHDLRNTVWEGDPGYPTPETETESNRLREKEAFDLEPTLLLNANEICLYGIFRLKFGRKEKAFLFQTANPFAGWNFVTSAVPGQKGDVPQGFSSSPGVYLDDKLWLLGGSQIDSEITSNAVWCFDPQSGAWENWESAAWPPRMGHAILVFQNQIWVLGGRDAAGNALNDVWSLDVESRQWKPHGQGEWSARCLCHPAVFKNQIWLFGGAKKPFAQQAYLYDDLYAFSADSGQWEEKKFTGIMQDDTSRKPIASCLQVFQNKLCLFGKFRTINAADKSERVEPLAFSLTRPSTRTWEDFPSDGLKGWGPDTTFSYQLVSFRNKMLIARALGYESANSVMKVYVPG
jgi:hypothetical protein